ncbi:hypothetical protein ACLOAV_000678 [Pseudogymnoascus australis]
MRFSTFSVVTAAAGFAAAFSPEGVAAPRVNAAVVAAAGGFKDMVLKDIHTTTLATSSITADNRQISFHITDPNFSTSTTCSTTWYEAPAYSSNTTRPGSYIPCKANIGVKESYQWFFDSYTELGDFTLELAHSFSDPANYPPPWDVVGLFAMVNVTLTCEEGKGGRECALGEGKSVRAPVYAAIN